MSHAHKCTPGRNSHDTSFLAQHESEPWVLPRQAEPSRVGTEKRAQVYAEKCLAEEITSVYVNPTEIAGRLQELQKVANVRRIARVGRLEIVGIIPLF